MCYKRDCHGRYFIIISKVLYIYNYIYNMYIYTHVNYKILLIILYDIVFTYYPLAAKVTYVPLKEEAHTLLWLPADGKPT